MQHSGITQSFWMATSARPQFAPLTTNLTTDVVIVGGGIAGLTTAYLLSRAGRSVVVLESGPIASGETERTTAHLANAMDDRFVELERIHGLRGAQLAAESHGAAINRIEEIVRTENIQCGFQRLDAYLFAPPGAAHPLLEAELAAARRAGLADASLVAAAPLPHFNTGVAIRFRNQAQFNPLLYLSALSEAILRQDGRIFELTHVTSAEGGDRARVRTASGNTVSAQSLVIATNSPINDRIVLHTKQAAYRTYAIAASLAGKGVPKALYWDTADPYHYVRLSEDTAGNETLIAGGEDHRTGQGVDAVERYARLEKWTRERFPIGNVTFRWSGQVLEPVDCLGFIGRNPMDHDNVYVVTGDSGQGMTHGTLAGMILTDLISGRSNRWAALYDPARKSGGKDVTEFVKDGMNITLQYAKWLTPGEVPDETAISPGNGAILRRGASKIAVYRDEHGNFHECSAVCPHLSGIVSWNPAEKSWDCPVHGSRFDAFGKLINGPAKSDLQPLQLAAHK
ncbi:MAG TPA: FAD-dependent oxidoreductase [Opitutus sp.]|nr:FAD-dependent oxidoreductase [Opitutus sp.]